mmetsp:Transcript_27834/g.65610  ORF Transcript_27834/g.65610 Transcript_27834/m.65610 type:complete len:278 (+) Transcript_27834:405-1238(+)
MEIRSVSAVWINVWVLDEEESSSSQREYDGREMIKDVRPHLLVKVKVEQHMRDRQRRHNSDKNESNRRSIRFTWNIVQNNAAGSRKESCRALCQRSRGMVNELAGVLQQNKLAVVEVCGTQHRNREAQKVAANAVEQCTGGERDSDGIHPVVQDLSDLGSLLRCARQAAVQAVENGIGLNEHANEHSRVHAVLLRQCWGHHRHKEHRYHVEQRQNGDSIWGHEAWHTRHQRLHDIMHKLALKIGEVRHGAGRRGTRPLGIARFGGAAFTCLACRPFA